MSEQDLTPSGEFILYQTEDGRTRVECRFADETLWLSQALIAELFNVSTSTINEHLKNIYAEGELDAEATIRKFRIVRREGTRDVRRLIEYYNLDAILAVGYRVRSAHGTQFRRWATERLTEYLVKGFTMDDDRLKNPPVAGSAVPDYFDELLERIRDIRASERRMYLRVQDIFAMAGDYNPQGADTTQCRTEFTVTMKLLDEVQMSLDVAQSDLGMGNRLTLLDDELLKNLSDIQLRGGLPPSGSLTSGDFTVEMETSTSKTYVYLRTIFELNKRYGFSEFVIVVPSGAAYRHWWRAKLGRRYRLFFRYDSKAKVIVYAWVNDELTLRSSGSKSDPYAMFEKMDASAMLLRHA